jgi:3-dehydroquinate dehydratase / shikimate dehydrogenase
LTFVVVSILVESVQEVSACLERVRAAVEEGAHLVEWRIDPIADEPEAVGAVRRLVRESPLPCILTCRRAEEGGVFAGDESTRISLLEAVALDPHPPRYVDVELAAYRSSRNLRQKVNLAIDHPAQVRDLSTSLILSSHDFEGRPADLLQRVEAMAHEEACRVIKVAWRARSLRDNLEAFDLLTERRKPMVALCMGEFGLLSRVLAPKFNALLTFASDGVGAGTAPGQPNLSELRSLYRFGAINRETRVYGVVGWPVAHSQSPLVHNAAFGLAGKNAVYLPLPIPPEWEHFKATVGALIDHNRLDFSGASVTIPHKEHLIRFVKERGGCVDPLAERIGAANTLVVGADRMPACFNTDAPAAASALDASLIAGGRPLAHCRVAVIGAGGAARAAAVGLADTGAQVVIVNRNAARAEKAAADLLAAGATRLSAGRLEDLACGCFHAFVNCTPVGMKGGPAPDESPLPDDVHLDDSITVMDTVYTPRRTPLLREAAARGARVVDGLAMFERQASLQFELWMSQPISLGALDTLRAASPA